MAIDIEGRVLISGRLHKKTTLARLLMEEYLGRSLTKDEVVHHIDGDPFNDEISNLTIMSRANHFSLHRTGKVCSKETREKMSCRRREGENAPMKGKLQSETAKKNMREMRRIWKLLRGEV
jgi:hypothetical protein